MKRTKVRNKTRNMELRKAIEKEKIFSEMKVQLQNTQGRIASSEILIKDIEEKHRKKLKR